MNLKQLGEFNLIRKLAETLQPAYNDPSVVKGIGDDCAVISTPGRKGTTELVTTDMLIEGTHFIRHLISPRDLGFKSLAVNLSDIAAMGGKPKYCFLSFALPSDLPLQWMEEFFAGFKELAQKVQISLLGGDTTASPQHICINITLLGEAPLQNIKWRSTAQPGDIILVTDSLGDSSAGLKCELEEIRGFEKLVERHYRPHPALKEGEFLGGFTEVHGMMDISDGLASDLVHILEESKCGAQINLETLPLSQELLHFCQSAPGREALEFAVCGGEDYSLLVTCAPEKVKELSKKYLQKFDKPLYSIGQITSINSGVIAYFENGVPSRSHRFKPYDPFK